MLPWCPRTRPPASAVAIAVGQGRAGAGRLDDLVDDADLGGPVRCRRRSSRVRRPARPRPAGGAPDRHLGELAAVQDPDRRDRAHHGHLGPRPREHPGRTQRARVHRDVGAAVRLPGHQRHPRYDRLRERVQQLGATSYDAVPLLTDTRQIPGYVDQHDHRYAERVAHPDEAGRLLRRQRVQATTEPERVVRDHADGPAAEPAERGDDVRRPPLVQFDARTPRRAPRRPADGRRTRASPTPAATRTDRCPGWRSTSCPGSRAGRPAGAPARAPPPRSRW